MNPERQSMPTDLGIKTKRQNVFQTNRSTMKTDIWG